MTGTVEESNHRFSVVAHDFEYGDSFQMGHFCVIESDVKVGKNVTIGNHVVLKSGTRIGNNVVLADYVTTTGVCLICNDVVVRTRSTISKGVILEPWVFVAGDVMTSHTSHPVHGRPGKEHKQYVTRIGFGAILGSCSCLRAGAHVHPNAIVGYGAVLIKPTTTIGIFAGNPAVCKKTIPPVERGPFPGPTLPEIEGGLLGKYLPGWKPEYGQGEIWAGSAHSWGEDKKKESVS